LQPAVRSESDAAHPPSLDEQRGFWNQWNATWRSGDLDEFMAGQRQFAVSRLSRKGIRGAASSTSAAGPGGWGTSLRDFGSVTATDLSEAAIAPGRQRHPEVQFFCGNS
jgi:hypothetical protein